MASVDEKQGHGRVLEFDKVTKSFAKTDSNEITHALAEVNLTIQPGEFVSIVGTSGCGKSTILRLIAGLIRPTTGEIRLGGKPIVGAGPDRGMVFQKATLFPWLTVEKNVSFSLRMQKKQDKELVEHMLKMVGLEDFRKDYPHQLSGGMAQRVALVRSLINHPDILLLDEPLGALDAFTRMNMQDEILKIWQEKEQLAIMVAKGDIDYAVCDQQTAVLSQKQLPEIDIKTDISFTQLQSWAVRKDSPILLDSLNSWLEQIRKNGTFDKIYKKYYK